MNSITFQRQQEGYNVQQVNSYIEMLTGEYQNLYSRYQELQTKFQQVLDECSRLRAEVERISTGTAAQSTAAIGNTVSGAIREIDMLNERVTRDVRVGLNEVLETARRELQKLLMTSGQQPQNYAPSAYNQPQSNFGQMGQSQPQNYNNNPATAFHPQRPVDFSGWQPQNQNQSFNGGFPNSVVPAQEQAQRFTQQYQGQNQTHAQGAYGQNPQPYQTFGNEASSNFGPAY